MTNRLWITYAWKDNDEGDFDYLVGQLARVGVEASYDKIALVPGRRLWQQIAERILDPNTRGWASLLTPASMASEACQEELAIALDRALRERGDFPLIGLLHQVPIEEAPPALRIRLCVDLDDPEWPEQVLASLENRPPQPGRRQEGKYVAQLHRRYLGDPSRMALEFRPRFGQLVNWVFLVPKGTEVLEWGVGPANGGALVPTRMVRSAEATDQQGVQWSEYGGMESLWPSVSAYLVLPASGLPDRVFLGEAMPDGSRGKWIPLQQLLASSGPTS